MSIQESSNILQSCSITFLMRKYKINWKAAEKILDGFYEEEGIIFEKEEKITS